MSKSFKRLESVLNLEAQQGYLNKAVVGGIQQFATFWVDQARQEAVDEADKALVEQVAEVLMEYGRLPGPDARNKAIQSLLTSLGRRQTRLGAAAPPAKPSRPPRPQEERREKSEERGARSEERREKNEERGAKREERGEKRERVEEQRPRPEPAMVEERPFRRQEKESNQYSVPGSQYAAQPSTPETRPPQVEVPPDPAGLAQSVMKLKGVGPKISQPLGKLGATTIEELLYIFPRRYDDYTLMKPIRDLKYGEQVTIIGTIWETRARRMRTNQEMVQATINDGTAAVQVTWFNQPWLTEKLKAGMQIVISGKVEQYLGRPVFNSPEWEPLEMDPLRTRRIVPVYPLSQGLNSTRMRDIMQTAVSYWGLRVPDPLPKTIRERQKLYSLPQAIQQLHFPDSQESLHHARQRLVFDELFHLQLGMQAFRREWQREPGIELTLNSEQLAEFEAVLPYQFTGAQRRVIGEIAQDLGRAIPMNRLLQGDVGAGKTVVAAAAMFLVAKAGAQAALMAPTEILAEQHYRGLSKLLAPLGLNLCLLTGNTSAADREQIYADLASGVTHIAIGTHALIQPSVTFHKLALAVIDEQHRFGVDQRQALREKGAETAVGKPNPHLLIMSATPIPRTLAISLFGDLDLSILDEMPPGRQEIKTRWLRESERERAYDFIRRQVKDGRQAYIIYPLVEESDKVDAKAAVDEHARLQEKVFPDLKVGLVHGRMRSDEKDAAMRAFYGNETQILVATSVIEVGVDVPNSTVMVIEGANRFGLAQLHQFRGRVGRGEHQSYCVLIADNSSADAEERLTALTQTNDGFALAEKDLQIRGPGEFFGRRQSGLPELRLASLLDMQMLELARAEAQAVFAEDPTLEKPEFALIRERVSKFWQSASDMS